jgi:hypothetical protein
VRIELFGSHIAETNLADNGVAKLRGASLMFVYGDDGSDAKKERVTAVSVIAGYEHW